jgi:hypothetical protein
MSQRIGTLEAADKAGITYRQIDYWIRTGRIHPAGWKKTRNNVPHFYANREWTGGSGTSTRIDEDELGVLLHMALLTKAGLAVQQAHDAARYMMENHSDYAPLGHGVVIMVREVEP